MTAELRRLVRFGLVGVSNLLLSVAVYAVLTRAGLGAAAASALAFGAGAANGYHLNRRWTFRGTDGGPRIVARYVAVQALGAALSAAGVALAITDLDFQHMAAEVLVLPWVTLLTYTLSRRLVFARRELA
jgi:putative flippase GtrA